MACKLSVDCECAKYEVVCSGEDEDMEYCPDYFTGNVLQVELDNLIEEIRTLNEILSEKI